MATFPSRLFLNDRDVATFKMLVASPKGFIGPASRSDQLQNVPGRTGQSRVSGEGETQARRFTVQAVIRGDTAAEKETLWDQFVAFTGTEVLEVRFLDWPNRVGYARLDSMPVEWMEGAFQGQKFTLSFTMANPLKYAVSPDVYSITAGSEVPLVLGSAPSDVRLQFVSIGSISNPQALYRDAQGLIRGDVRFALNDVSFPLGNWVDYNPDGYELARQYATNGTVVTDVAPIYGSPWGAFVADPNDGDASQGPTITALNCNVIALVNQAWE